MKTKISLMLTRDRQNGIPAVLDLLRTNPVKGRKVLLKPNFNTADEFPGSTHNDTLAVLIQELRKNGALSITVADRSGPASTSEVIREKGVDALCAKLGADLINLENLPDSEWVRIVPKEGHWNDGFLAARPLVESECVVSTCCLKTHGFGGVFTMSLKLSIGMVHKKNMNELHLSVRSMRKMIAEANLAYSPSLILLDGIEAFVDGGPMTGTRKSTGVLIAGTDRIAIDAVGLAVLKETGSNKAVMSKKIFEQEQISRAVELGIGVSSPDSIEIVTPDKESEKYAAKLRRILNEG